jgi:hypothetical protein
VARYMTIVDYNKIGGQYGPELIHRLAFYGSTAKIVGTAELKTNRNRFSGQTSIQGRKALAISTNRGLSNVGIWRYPAGGRAPKTLKNPGPDLFGVTVSAGV